jgi:hypothetical protein
VLRKRRGSLTEKECITRITDLLSYGVGERKSCRVVGVIWREWNEWKRANLHNLEQQIAFAKLVRISAVHDEMMEIVDDPDLRRADIKTVKKWVKDATTGKDKEIEVEEVILTPREKLAIAAARISTRKWSLEKLLPAFTPRQMSLVQSISHQVSIDELTPQEAMDRYRQILLQ